MLDPCTLGRPFHLFDDFHAALRERVGRYLHDRYNHRRGAQLAVADSAIVSLRAGDDCAGWHGYGSSQGSIGIRIERSLLIALMGYQYGERADRPVSHDLPPETRTEQRFAATTQQALLDAVLPVLAPDAAPLERRRPEPPGPGARIVRVAVRDAALDLTGRIEFALDDAWLERLFAALASRRPRNGTPPYDEGELGMRIPVLLNATMVTKELALGDVLNLKPGAVLPVRLPDFTDASVDGVRVFRAAVVEHEGKLCLTSVEFTE
ncbi:FliM/FliN family flagellar motor switch protein [Burkholderia ubonensis]|uniref:FliM/FliN family flagellar motor switch protein n=1 Tax=Burkholderia ubonensis TaxID=101571 RepID=UPI0012F95B56|nr:FliM/FliN family flagellar motor C-terminal domain-containing protein [Burkholderia ubonensis]